MPKFSSALFIFAISVLAVACVMYNRVGFVEAKIAPRPEVVQSQGQWLVFGALAVCSAIIALALLGSGL